MRISLNVYHIPTYTHTYIIHAIANKPRGDIRGVSFGEGVCLYTASNVKGKKEQTHQQKMGSVNDEEEMIILSLSLFALTFVYFAVDCDMFNII